MGAIRLMASTPKQFPDVRGKLFSIIVPFLAVAVTACGGGGGSGSTGGNQPPVAVAGCGFTPADTPFTDRLEADDPNNDALTYTIVQQGTLGRAETDVAGNYRYTPNGGARGRDSFVFRVTDSADNQATGTVSMIVGYTRIMPLGDSITQGVTIGAGCSGGDTNCPPEGARIGYRKSLYDQLTAAGYYVQFVGNLANGTDAGLATPNDRHEGHGTYSTQRISNEVSGWLSTPDAGPHVVLLHAGTNDANDAAATAGTPSPDSRFVTDTTNGILARIYQYSPQTTVLVAKIVGSPSTAVDPHIANFNTDLESQITASWAGQVAAGRLILVDMYGALNNRIVGGDFADNLHPNNAGYQKMANTWLARLTASNLLPRCP